MNMSVIMSKGMCMCVSWMYRSMSEKMNLSERLERLDNRMSLSVCINSDLSDEFGWYYKWEYAWVSDEIGATYGN